MKIFKHFAAALYSSLLFFVCAQAASPLASYVARYSAQKKIQECAETVHKEGIASGTRVVTPDGFVLVENLKVGDVISADGAFCEQVIRDISYRELPEYICITLDNNEIMRVGSQQQLYVMPERTWVTADRVQIGDYLEVYDNKILCVIDAQKVKESIVTYTVTTSAHSFFIGYSGVYVHNNDAAMLSLGCLSLVNPVVATIGATVALGVGAIIMYESLHKISIDFPSDSEESENSAEVSRALQECERQYYEKRKSELLKLEQDFIGIKSGLETIGQLSRKNTVNFTDNFLQQIKIESAKPLEKISLHNEAKMNQPQREKLRKNRETELLAIESRIVELQTAISFHFNELIDRVNNALKKYDAYAVPIKKVINQRNTRLKDTPLNTALQSFEITMRALHLIENVETRADELKHAIAYYQKLDKTSVIKQTTNITDAIAEFEFAEREKSLKEKKEWLIRNKALYERYLSALGFNVPTFHQNFASQIQAENNQYEAQEFAAAQNKYKNTPRNQATLSQSKMANNSPCTCGCRSKCFNNSCGCECGCPCGKEKPERKTNKISKQEFFSSEIIKANYEHYKDGVYRLKAKGQVVVKNGYYLVWDHLHNDVEVYSKSETHLGSLDPATLKLYKPPVNGRDLF